MTEEIWRNILIVVAAFVLPSVIAFGWASVRKKDDDEPRVRKRSPAKEG